MLRREPEGDNGRKGRSPLKYAALRIAARPVALRGIVRVARSFKATAVRPLRIWEHHPAQKENGVPVIAAPERPSGIGELINTLLRAGYSMKQIRAMYPGLFPNNPQPGS